MSEETVTPVEGIEGNLYEVMPDAWLYTAESKKAERLKAAEQGPDVDAVAKAKSAVDAGAAAPDHGKAAGASNALAFHTFGKDADGDDDKDGDS